MSRSRQPSERRRSGRMAPLPVLPVFLPLQGRPALVAGGSDAAAWKAELLAAAGASVTVVAPGIDGEMAALIDDGLVQLAGLRSWTPTDLAGMAVAVIDAGDDAEASAFVAAGRAAGAIVNAIDSPDHCDMQFGSIVNRSPVVVGISTAGAAPVLAQAIRRRIETVLPRSLSRWAEAARTVRARVMDRLKPGAERRRFWELFAESALGGGGPDSDGVPAAGIDRWFDEARADGGGRVTLVGAGPGDPDLLTVKAVRALQSADVILFDDLVSDGVLELARREARRMLVGKRGGRESCRQETINDMMVAWARSGRHVVRLKSGDPMVFGRAGEEIRHLRALGIPVEMVPGISAGVAAAATLGVSLTHRDHAQSVRFVTGHSRLGRLPDDLDWAGIADPRTTTVFYMGGRTATRIADRLMGHGLSGSTPVSILANVSRPGERRWRGTLGSVAAGIGEIGWQDPVLIVVGSVLDSIPTATLDGSGALVQDCAVEFGPLEAVRTG